jgi:ABC-type transport system substrate-binding protein
VLAACGSDAKDDRATATPPLSLSTDPQDTTNFAKQGGTLKSVAIADVPSFDPHSATSTVVHTQVAAYTYPRLLKFATARFPDRPIGNTDGDLAESYELSADRLQATFRLRQGMKWDPRAPVNGRLIDAQDVVSSWQRFSRLSPFRTEMLFDAAIAPGAPVESVSSPDPRTVVVKLKQPDAGILALFASDRLFYVLPREADAGFDPRLEPRGYGPYRLNDNRPGVFRSWARNPEYFVKGRPLIDTIEMPVIGDYSSRLAQFTAGNIWTHVAGQGEILRLRDEIAALTLTKLDNFSTAPSSLAFGYDESYWKDERLRQAVSLLVDRETLIDVQTNRTQMAAEGLDIDVRYQTAVGAGWSGYWIDPTSPAFGPNKTYFTFDPGEAAKLLSAAGFPEGIDSILHYNGGGQYGPIYNRTVELVSGMLTAGGIRLRLEPHDFPDWTANFQSVYAGAASPGKQPRGFSGLIYRIGSPSASVPAQLFAQFHKDGVRFEGMTPDGRNPQNGDPEVNNAVMAIRREFDLQKQQALSQDFARLMAKKAYVIPNLPFSASGFSLTWPALANVGVYRSWPAGNAIAEANLNLWVDVKKPPLAPA